MKKNIPVILGAAVIVIAVAAMLMFVFSGDVSDTPVMDLTGTWKIVMNCSDGVPGIPENDSVVFDSETASVYQNGQPYAVTGYTLGSVKLEMPDISRSYDFTKISDNLIKLVMTADNYMYLYRMDGPDAAVEDITGSWDVLCHGGTASSGEKLVFADGTAQMFKDGSAEPAMTSAYTWTEDGHLLAQDWGMELVLAGASENQMILVDTNGGYVWQLQKAA